MSNSLPSSARVVIVGGGVIGCSVAYHLTKLGIRDIVLLERKSLTCGTTWHAAGLVPTLRATYRMSMLASYSADLYERLSAETGQATGFVRNGSLSIATHQERFTELKRGASMAKLCGFPCEVVSPDEAKALWPLMDIDDIVGGIHLPLDGIVNPVDVTQALARGARLGGARIFENTPVVDIKAAHGKAAGVITESGEIDAEFVVNCSGMWARGFGKKAGVNVPLHAAEHYYVVTESMPDLAAQLPTLRDLDGCNYFKTEAGKLLIGTFEPNAQPWGHQGIPDSFSFDELPPDLDHLEPYLEAAMRRVPALANLGLQVVFNGPESFTPDDRYHLGEAPELRNYFVAAGFNSVGIQSAGGAGKVLAEWIARGHAPMDLWEVDIRRNQPFQGNAEYLYDRTREGLGLLYAMHWPYRQFETARNVRRSILHERLAGANACFGEVAGWERANFFAPNSEKAEYRYSWGKQNWFEWSAAEHMAVRERVGLFDQSSFTKLMVQGRDAMTVLNRICSNDIDVEPGRIVYTQWLNERGGIEADLTVTRLETNNFLIVSGAPTQTRDLDWLRRHTPEEANMVIADVTSSMAVLAVMGPEARSLLQQLTGEDLTNHAFPFGTSKEIELGYARVRASRITYVGELGWELYIPTEFAPDVFDRIVAAGKTFDLKLCGYHALNSLRIEKGYRHFGHDIAEEDSPLEAGLSFAVAFNKPGGFIGREALQQQQAEGVKKRMVLFRFLDPEATSYHEEPIYRDGVIVGRTTSGMYGHYVGGNVAMGYVEHADGVTPEWIKEGDYEIEIAMRRHKVEASLRAFHDPGMTRVKS
ncbi:FAD-dependent oxidoreductase [Halomonas sp. DQ26W]|uniref:GcvT family protein n=1 Tax=Halomonas sp. DQ26W TaxID=2282311 RepID=UPI000DF83307|nr:FAD-dependent oxidoreductase [Halomonas sp. DQ26W]RDB43206.1 FAD-dependent oxidoreductase [Halomonas sp. DQ26W]